jgi:hypothetical protein
MVSVEASVSVGAGVRVVNPGGSKVGVANWNKAVGVGPGVIVDKLPASSAVAVLRGLGGFCQITRKLAIRIQRMIKPAPSPPSRNLSNIGLNFAGGFMPFTQTKIFLDQIFSWE